MMHLVYEWGGKAKEKLAPPKETQKKAKTHDLLSLSPRTFPSTFNRIF